MTMWSKISCCCTLAILSTVATLVASFDDFSSSLRVHGPGWDSPQLIFPSRYFLVDHLSSSVTVEDVVVEGRKVNGAVRPCPAWVQLLNETKYNSVVIVRYRLLDSCLDGLVIKLLDRTKRVLLTKEAPGPIFHEKCHCQVEGWQEKMKCDQKPEAYQQIYSDLSVFNNSKFDFQESLSEAKRRFAPHTRSYSFCHYQIRDGEIFRHCYGEYVGFAQFVDNMLISLIKKVRLPDMQFMMNLGDWPLSDKKAGSKPFPMFSWCGSQDTNDIVLPTYEITESTLYMQDRVSVDILSIFGKQSHADYEDKVPKLFWRGRDSNRHRLHLVELSKKYPKLIDAAFTDFFFFRDQMEKYGPTVPRGSFFDFFKYKYQINVDGTVAAYRMPLLLAGTSLILKPESKYYEHYYSLLKEDQHYVKVASDLSDLIATLKKLMGKGVKSDGSGNLMSTQQHQQVIVNNARHFVLEHLLPANIYCYYFKALQLYSSLSKDAIQPANGMTLVYSRSKASCGCQKAVIKDEL